MIMPNLTTLANTAANHAAGSGAHDSQTPTNQMFLQLLVTQLKDQSPLDPMDPNQFTSQLVEFNMLDQLTQIRSLLQSQLSNGQPSTTSSNSNRGGL